MGWNDLSPTSTTGTGWSPRRGTRRSGRRGRHYDRSTSLGGSQFVIPDPETMGGISKRVKPASAVARRIHTSLNALQRRHDDEARS